eukprot:1831599-Karenia_brevis.AAC.1
MTKYLAQADLHRHFESLGLSKENERPKAAAELSRVEIREEERERVSHQASEMKKTKTISLKREQSSTFQGCDPQ